MPQIVAEHVQLIMNKSIYTASLSGLQFKYSIIPKYENNEPVLFLLNYNSNTLIMRRKIKNRRERFWLWTWNAIDGEKELWRLFDDDEIPADMSKKETIVNATSKNITAVKEILKYCIILF